MSHVQVCFIFPLTSTGRRGSEIRSCLKIPSVGETVVFFLKAPEDGPDGAVAIYEVASLTHYDMLPDRESAFLPRPTPDITYARMSVGVLLRNITTAADDYEVCRLSSTIPPIGGR